MTDEIKKGACFLNKVPSFIRKIGDNGVVCFHYGRASGMQCMKIEEFKNKYSYSTKR